MPKGKYRRSRHSEEQWIEILKRFESSGLSVPDFCRREDLASSSFQRWRNRLGSVAVAEFVELVPAVQPSAASSSWSLDVSLPNGVCLRFQG